MYNKKYLFSSLNVFRKLKVILPIAIAGLLSQSLYAQHQDSGKLVDRYGQLINISFEAKVANDEQLKRDVADDRKYYASLHPPLRDEYGGLKGSKEQLGLKRTGFFRVEKLKNKPVLVDPLGNLYFSIGVNGVGYTGDTYTKVKRRENIFEWLPEITHDRDSPDNVFSSAYMNGNSDNFSFYIANRIRKEGDDFDKSQFYNESVLRLQKWGFTSEGGFSSTPEHPSLTFPQVAMLELPQIRIPGSSLPDVYHAAYEKEMIELFQKQGIAQKANDPMIVGYFSGNEIDYHQFKHILPSKKSSEVASKRILVNYLKERYKNIQSFNTAWQSSFNSFRELEETSIPLTTEKASNDMMDFFEIYLDKFYRIVSETFKKFDNNHLLLGDRYFTPVMADKELRERICRVAGKYLDVISYNYYTYQPDLERIKDIYEISGKPVMLTEFHYGDPTQGQTSSIEMVDDEAEKGYAYRNYVENMAATGFVVGTHWFEYLDQAVTGRWFEGDYGEGFGIGLLNVADRPYKTFLNSVMATNYSIYDLILSNKKPYHYDFGPGKTARTDIKTITIFKTSKPIAIDGILDDYWPNGETINLTDKERVAGSRIENSSATISMTYDENNLYLYAHILDDNPMTNQFSGQDVWNGDGVEIFFGPEHIEEDGALKVKDRQLVMGGSLTGEPTYYWFNGVQQQPEIKMTVKRDDNKKGYSIEAAIPLNALNISDIFKGKKVRFDIGLDNGDQRQRNAMYMWNGTESNSTVRDHWGILIFN